MLRYARIRSALGLVVLLGACASPALRANARGIELLRERNLEEAAAQFHSAVKLSPNDFSNYGNLGNTYFLMGKWDESEHYFREALRLSAVNPFALSGLALLYSAQGKLAEAEALAKEAIKHTGLMKTDNAAYAHRILGRIHLIQGREADAKREMLEAVRQNADDTLAYLFLALIYHREGNSEQSSSSARHFGRLSPDLEPGLDHPDAVAGFALVDLGRYAEAEAVFRDAIRREPNVRGLRRLFGMLYALQERYAEAERELRDSSKVGTKHAALSHYYLSYVFDKTGRPTEAVREYDAALQIWPEVRRRVVPKGLLDRMAAPSGSR